MEPTTQTSRWILSKPSATQMLFIALAASIIFSVYLLFKLQAISEQRVTIPVDQGTTTGNESIQGLNPSPSNYAQDLDVMAAQLQEMQSALQASADQIALKSGEAGQFSGVVIPQADQNREDVQALENEIGNLYQVMQPLMVQLEVAASSQSSRSPTEISALRAQVDFIHQRLDYLLGRLEKAKGGLAGSAWDSITPGAAQMVEPGQPTLEQIYQDLVQIQTTLQQMQNAGPAGE